LNLQLSGPEPGFKLFLENLRRERMGSEQMFLEADCPCGARLVLAGLALAQPRKVSQIGRVPAQQIMVPVAA